MSACSAYDQLRACGDPLLTYLVGLYVGLRDWLKFRGGNSVEEPVSPTDDFSACEETLRMWCTYSVNTGRSNASRAYAINFFKSVLLIAPMGLTSAALPVSAPSISSLCVKGTHLKSNRTW